MGELFSIRIIEMEGNDVDYYFLSTSNSTFMLCLINMPLIHYHLLFITGLNFFCFSGSMLIQ